MRHQFRRLQWKITLSYTLGAVTVALIVHACLLVGLGYLLFGFGGQLLLDAQPRALAAIAVQATPYLQGDSPDRSGLTAWLNQLMDGSRLDIHRFPVTAPPVENKVVLSAVVDVEHQVLAVTPPTATLTLDPPTTTVLQAAWRGQTEPAALVARGPQGEIIAGTPLLDNQQRVRAAWIVITHGVPSLALQESITTVLFLLIPVALVALPVALLVGAGFGYSTSRRLVRRLSRLANATNAWSIGNFNVVVHDQQGDELSQLAQRLNQMAEQVQALVQVRQELAVLEERNRLARDLHDAVKQQLFAVSMQLASARALLHGADERVATCLANADHLTQAAQQELTATIQALRPAALEQTGLAGTLRAYIAAWSRQHGIATTVVLPPMRLLSLRQEQALFRITQEALANVARHSNATHTDIYMTWEQHVVTLIIQDNGRGFAPTRHHGPGMGLASMRERATAAQGMLEVQSQPGSGTQILVRLARTEDQHAGANYHSSR